jgi:SprT protein
VVEISRRGKTVAGKAYTRERRIVLNTALFLPGREADRNSTFLHECAHVIADIRYGRDCGHGWRWRRVMDLMGEPPDTRHEFSYLSPKTHAVVTWVCRNCGEEYYYVRRPRRRIEESCCSRCGPHRGELFAKSRATALQ